jgi:hypothetical protein
MKLDFDTKTDTEKIDFIRIFFEPEANEILSFNIN